MKVSSIFKYIFIIFVIGIIAFSGYKIYEHNLTNKEETSNETVKKDEAIIKDVRLAVSNYDSINPLITKNKQIIDIDKLIFEPLFKISKDYKLESCLGTEWSKTGDNTYIVKIDTTAKWTDGAYVTAKDVQFTIDRLKEGNSVYKSNVAHITGVEVIDASTIKIIVDQNVPFFEYNLTFPIMSNMYYFGDNFYTSGKTPIGTGRFKISNVSSTSITLTKNTDWKKISQDDSKVDTIKINLFSSMGEVFNSFRLGNVDLLNTTTPNYQDYVGKIGFTCTESAGREFDYISLNCQDSVLQDKSVRKAINYSIDKENIVTSVYNNQKLVANYPLDYGNYLYSTDNNSSGFNAEQAKKTLVDNGWTYSNNKWKKQTDDYNTTTLKLEISVQKDNQGRLNTANTIKNQLENIGIKTTVKELSNEQYKNCLENKNYQMLITGVYNSFSPDLSYYYGEGNLENYHNDEILGILSSGVSIKNEQVLSQGYQRIYDIFKEEVPFIGLYRNKNTTITSTSLVGKIFINNYSSFYEIGNWYRR